MKKLFIDKVEATIIGYKIFKRLDSKEDVNTKDLEI